MNQCFRKSHFIHVPSEVGWGKYILYSFPVKSIYKSFFLPFGSHLKTIFSDSMILFISKQWHARLHMESTEIFQKYIHVQRRRQLLHYFFEKKKRRKNNLKDFISLQNTADFHIKCWYIFLNCATKRTKSLITKLPCIQITISDASHTQKYKILHQMTPTAAETYLTLHFLTK